MKNSASGKNIMFLAGLAVVMYLPVLGTYAHTDSYEFFRNAERNPEFIHVFIQGGRPIFGFIVTTLFQATETIADLKYIRAIALAGNVLLLIFFYRFLLKSGFTKNFSLALTVFFCSSSFIGLVTAWTALFQAGWAALVSLWSVLLYDKAFSGRGHQRIFYLAGCVLAGIAALMMYQPAFTFFIFLSFVAYDRNRNLFQFTGAAGVYLAIYLIYFVIFKLILWYTGLPPLGRTDLEFNLFSKLEWFLDTALVHAFKFNLLLVRNSFVNLLRVPVLILFLWAAIQYFRQGIAREKITYAVLVLFVYVLGYIPNLVSTENHASNRSLITVVLLNAFFLYKLIDHLLPAARPKAIAYTIITGIFVVFGFTNLRYGITRIQSAEYAILKNRTFQVLAADTAHRIDTIHIIRPSRQFLQEQGIIQRESGGEFGLLSNSVDWATLPMFETFVEDIAKETGHDASSIHLNICHPGGEATCQGHAPLIDIGHEFVTHYRDYHKTWPF